MPEALRNKIIWDVANAIKFLHHTDLPPCVHRDLKTPNILVSFTMF